MQELVSSVPSEEHIMLIVSNYILNCLCFPFSAVIDTNKLLSELFLGFFVFTCLTSPVQKLTNLPRIIHNILLI